MTMTVIQGGIVSPFELKEAIDTGGQLQISSKKWDGALIVTNDKLHIVWCWLRTHEGGLLDLLDIVLKESPKTGVGVQFLNGIPQFWGPLYRDESRRVFPTEDEAFCAVLEAVRNAQIAATENAVKGPP